MRSVPVRTNRLIMAIHNRKALPSLGLVFPIWSHNTKIPACYRFGVTISDNNKAVGFTHHGADTLVQLDVDDSVTLGVFRFVACPAGAKLRASTAVLNR